MRECENSCQKAWTTVNIKTLIFNLQYQYLGISISWNMDFCAKPTLQEDLSKDILYIFVGEIFSEILVKNRKLFTLIIHGTEVSLYTNKVHHALYIPQIRCTVDKDVYQSTPKMLKI